MKCICTEMYGGLTGHYAFQQVVLIKPDKRKTNSIYLHNIDINFP